MPSLKIDSGDVRLTINDDPSRVIVFNPKDALFVEHFYLMVGNFEKKQQEVEQQVKDLDENLSGAIQFNKEICVYVREQIDEVFGAGTSQTVFGDAMVLDDYTQFFEGITPYLKQARQEKLAPYLPKRPKRKRK